MGSAPATTELKRLSVTLTSLPLLSIYTASKAAVDAFTDVIALDLAQFGVRVRVVLPGNASGTRFGENVLARMTDRVPEPYSEMFKSILAGWEQDAGRSLLQEMLPEPRGWQ